MDSTSPGPQPYEPEELREAGPIGLLGLDRDRLAETSASHIAAALNHQDEGPIRDFLRTLPDERASEILSEMDYETAAEVFAAMREPRASAILESFSPDDAADLFEELEPEDQERLLGAAEPETAAEVKRLLEYDPDTAAGSMTTEVARVRESDSVDEAITQIRHLSETFETVYYLFVVDDEEHLRGVVSMRELLLAAPGKRIREIMKTNLYGVCRVDEDREVVAQRMAEFNLLALPVVDEDHHLLGIVTHDDVLDILREEATEDFQKLVGAGGDEGVYDSLGYSLRKRAPWLLVNLGTASLAGAIVYWFEEAIAQFAILAVFMPIISSIGGNAGAQALAVAIRGLATGEITPRQVAGICGREMLKGFVHGLIVGLAGGSIALALTQNLDLALAVLIAMTLTLTVGSLSGAFIPLTLKRFRLDPAQSSSIFLTALTDVAGFFIFLQIGFWFLSS